MELAIFDLSRLGMSVNHDGSSKKNSGLRIFLFHVCSSWFLLFAVLHYLTPWSWAWEWQTQASETNLNRKFTAIAGRQLQAGPA